MPWPTAHKLQTRDRIVQAAAAEFRAQGISGVRVDAIMARAGLTHGGFYAHFGSKNELLREALRHASRQTVESLSPAPHPMDDADARFRAVIDAYLSPAHAAHPEMGCPVASLGPELARAGGETQQCLAQEVRGRLEWMRSILPKQPRRRLHDDQVVGSLACMVGGLILARAVGGKDATALLSACRAFLHQSLGDAPEGTGDTKATAARPKKRRLERARRPLARGK